MLSEADEKKKQVFFRNFSLPSTDLLERIPLLTLTRSSRSWDLSSFLMIHRTRTKKKLREGSTTSHIVVITTQLLERACCIESNDKVCTLANGKIIRWNDYDFFVLFSRLGSDREKFVFLLQSWESWELLFFGWEESIIFQKKSELCWRSPMRRAVATTTLDTAGAACWWWWGEEGSSRAEQQAKKLIVKLLWIVIDMILSMNWELEEKLLTLQRSPPISHVIVYLIHWEFSFFFRR